ncbi:VWA domain-containing protein [Streptomyces sp. NPDC012421]|uniref:VWA domain-containing protein n=1 Tax=Streptomyces sp. NPDC012421 TaxID=3364832 RepID=UPI0036E94E05
MGIRSLLRKVFGRDREDPATPSVPPQSREPGDAPALPPAQDQTPAPAPTATPEPAPAETPTTSAPTTETHAAETPTAATPHAETPLPEVPATRSPLPEAPEDAARKAADDLVAAAFDNPQIPKARTSTAEPPAKPAGPTPATEPAEPATEAAETAPKAVAEAAETEAEPPAAAEPVPATTVAAEAESSEPAPSAEAETPADAEAEPGTDAAPEAATTAEAEARASTVEAVPAEAEPKADATDETAQAEPKADATDETAPSSPTVATVAADPAEAEPEVATVEAAPEARAEAATEAQPAAASDAGAPEAGATAEAESETTAEAAVAETAEAEPMAVGADETAPAAPGSGLAVPAEAEPEAVVADAAEPESAGTPAEDGTTAGAVTVETAPTVLAGEPTPSEATGRKTAAVSLARVKSAAPQLAEAYKAAGAVLRKEGLEGARARVYLVVDRSGSMRGYFKDGSVQRLAEQAVALAAHLDEEATVTTVFFSTDIDGVVDLAPADLTPTRVEEINAGLGRLGRTNYHRAVEEVLAHHEKADPARPALVIFQTDGPPESRTAATQALAEAAGRPVHWRFTAWGEEDGKGFDYLRKLTADRTATHFAGPAPVETPHAEFYRGVVAGLSL